jgi:hypothetical protein
VPKAITMAILLVAAACASPDQQGSAALAGTWVGSSPNQPGVEVETWDDLQPSEEKNRSALEKISQLQVDTPGESLTDISKPPKSQERAQT